MADWLKHIVTSSLTITLDTFWCIHNVISDIGVGVLSVDRKILLGCRKHDGKPFTSFPAELPHPLRFESKNGANLCVVSLEPRRNRINRNERTTSKRTPQFSVGISEKWPYDLPSIPNFPDFLSNRHPSPSSLFVRETWGKERLIHLLYRIWIFVWLVEKQKILRSPAPIGQATYLTSGAIRYVLSPSSFHDRNYEMIKQFF